MHHKYVKFQVYTAVWLGIRDCPLLRRGNISSNPGYGRLLSYFSFFFFLNNILIQQNLKSNVFTFTLLAYTSKIWPDQEILIASD